METEGMTELESSDREVRAYAGALSALANGEAGELPLEDAKLLLTLVVVELLQRGIPLPQSPDIDLVLGELVFRAGIDLGAGREAIDAKIEAYCTSKLLPARIVAAFRSLTHRELANLAEKTLRQAAKRYVQGGEEARYEPRTAPAEGQARGGLGAAIQFLSRTSSKK